MAITKSKLCTTREMDFTKRHQVTFRLGQRAQILSRLIEPCGEGRRREQGTQEEQSKGEGTVPRREREERARYQGGVEREERVGAEERYGGEETSVVTHEWTTNNKNINVVTVRNEKYMSQNFQSMKTSKA